MKEIEDHIYYSRIERAIHYLIDHKQEQPSLQEVASHVGMSKYHFQRIFTQWAGITPKQFLEHLTVESLKKEILRTRSILHAAESVGLSSQSRAYDLMVHVEAMTPGEYKKLGDGIEIKYGFSVSPFGDILVASTARGICALEFANGNQEEILYEVKKRWSKALFVEDAVWANTFVSQLFAGTCLTDINLHVKGSLFQLKVWKALLSIPEGHVATYSEIAQLIGQKSAVRAVASAIAKNPIGYIIPCHRVIRKEGAIGEYHWGAARKAAIIGCEASKMPQD